MNALSSLPRYVLALSCLSLLVASPAFSEEDPNTDVSLEWLVGSATKIGVFKVAFVKVGETTGRNSYTCHRTQKLRGKVPGTIIAQAGQRNVHRKTVRGDKLLLFLDRVGIRRGINLSSANARDNWGSAITQDFKVLESEAEILAAVTELIEAVPQFQAPHPINAATEAQPEYKIVEVPKGTPAYNVLKVDGTPRLIVPTTVTERAAAESSKEQSAAEPTAPQAHAQQPADQKPETSTDTAAPQSDTATETSTTEATASEGTSSLIFFAIGLVVAALIVFVRAKTRR